LRREIPLKGPGSLFPLREPVEKSWRPSFSPRSSRRLHVPVLEPMPLSREAEKISFDIHELMPS